MMSEKLKKCRNQSTQDVAGFPGEPLTLYLRPYEL